MVGERYEEPWEEIEYKPLFWLTNESLSSGLQSFQVFIFYGVEGDCECVGEGRCWVIRCIWSLGAKEFHFSPTLYPHFVELFLMVFRRTRYFFLIYIWCIQVSECCLNLKITGSLFYFLRIFQDGEMPLLREATKNIIHFLHACPIAEFPRLVEMGLSYTRWICKVI